MYFLLVSLKFHCAEVRTNKSAHDSLMSIVRSLGGNCENEGTCFAHCTARKRTLAANSNTASLERFIADADSFECVVDVVSAELVTSSSFALGTRRYDKDKESCVCTAEVVGENRDWPNRFSLNIVTFDKYALSMYDGADGG